MHYRDPPSTPERDRARERADERANRLMTPATERRERAAANAAQNRVPPPPPPFPLPQNPIPPPLAPNADPFDNLTPHARVAAIRAQIPAAPAVNPQPVILGSDGGAQLRAAAMATMVPPTRGRGRGRGQWLTPVP